MFKTLLTMALPLFSIGVIILSVITFSGCENKLKRINNTISTNKVETSGEGEFKTVLIDGCEYILWRHYEGGYASYSSGIVHKGNCKNHNK